MEALNILQKEPERINKLWENTNYIRHELVHLGFETGESASPIIPIYIRDNFKTFEFTSGLMEEGVFVNPVVSPAVPPDSSLIRLSMMATHTRNQIDFALDKIKKVADKIAVNRLVYQHS